MSIGFDWYLSDKTRPFRFLILDTPKQEELHTADLAQYLKELEKMCEVNNAQLIFSSTEYDHPTGPSDMRWLPTYRGPEKPMYLGKREDLVIEGEASTGQGLDHDDFKRRFKEICEEHLLEKRARIFAFVFYDMTHDIVREALKGAEGFRRLDETSGRDVSLFYLHDRAVEKHWNDFNQRFLKALKIKGQAEPPCMVVFKFEDGSFVDGMIFPLDYENKDAVTVANDMVHFLQSAIEVINKEGDLSAIAALPAAAMRLIGLAKFAEYLRG